MANIQIIDKDSQQVVLDANSSRVAISEPSVIKIQADIQQVAQVKRIGNNAIVVMKNGEKIVIEGFFDKSVNTNALVFENQNQQLTWIQFTRGSSAAQTVYYENIDSLAPVLDQGFFHFSPWTYGLGGVLLAGGIAAAAGGGGGGSGGGATPAAVTVTQDNADGLTGTAKAGSTIQVVVNNVVVGTTTTDSTGKWSFKNNPLAENQTGTITAKDTAGNVLGTISVLRPDGPPATPSDAPTVTDDVAPVVGNVTNNGTTNDNLPRLSGTATKGDVITIYDNGTAIGSTTVLDSGTWSFTPTTALTDGKHILTYSAKDSGGKESGKSPSVTINVDTQASATALNAATITDDQAPFVGNVANGASTNDQRPTISGSGTPGETISIYVDGVVNGTTQVSSNGSWTYTPSGNLSEGLRSIRYTSTDLAGNESAKSPEISILVDVTKPVIKADAFAIVTDNQAPVLGNVANAGVTNDRQPSFSGTSLNAGDTVTVFDNGVLLGSVTVSANGSWNFTPSTNMAEGSHSISYTVTDTAGNQSNLSPISQFTIDSQAPSAVVKITAISDDTDIGGDFITSDTSLTVAGTVTGLASGERVQISLDNGLTWSDVSQNSTSWTYTDTRTLQSGNVQYQVRVVDSAGNSTATVSKTVSIDTTLSNSAIAITSISDDTGTPADFITRDNVLTINGTVTTLVNGQKAQISLDNGSTWIDLSVNNGAWSYNDSRVLTEGDHVYKVRVVNSAGTIVGATAAQLVVVDSIAPTDPTTAPVLVDDVAPVVGNINTDTVSNDNKPTISGTGAPLNSIVFIYDNNSLIGSVTANSNGTWSYTPSSALAEGTHQINYSYKDIAGNESGRSGNVNFTVDTIAPATPSSAPTITDGLAPVTGNLANGSSTNDTKPIISGIGAVAGEIVQIYDGDTLIASVVVVINGSWSYSPSTPLTEGSHSFSYTRTDAAGNQSAKSASNNIIVDTTVPTASITVVNISDDTGVAGDFRTSDKSISLNGTVTGLASDERLQVSIDGQNWVDVTVNFGSWTFADSRTLTDGTYNYQIRAIDAAGNAAAPISKLVTIDSTLPTAAIRINSINDDTGVAGDYITSDSTITINGSVASLTTGQKAQISLDNGNTWIDLTLNSNNWSYSDTRILSDGNYSYQVRVVNSDGSTIGVSDTRSISIDTVAPAAPTTAPVVTDDQAPNTGNLSNASVTNDTKPTLSGTGLTANTVLNILDNGVVIGSTTVAANGSWSFTPSTALSEGSHALAYAITDVAGNRSVASPAVNITIDTTAPVLNININSISDDTGNAGDFVTADNTLTINGSVTGLATGEKLQISIDGTTWTDLTVSNNQWSFADARTLDNGTYTYLVRGIDAAGNVSNSVSRQVTVDNTAPTAAIRINSISDDTGTAGDFVTNDTSLTINGTVSGLNSGDKAQISLDGNNWQNLTVVNGNWSFVDPRNLTAGVVNYQVRVINSTETAVGATAAQAVTIDTTAPSYSSLIQIVRDSNNDGFINSTEQNGSTTTDVNITISNSAQAGDVISVKNGSVLLATYVVGQDVAAGTSKLITGISLPSDGSTLTITAETRDAAGNLSNVISSDTATMNSSANSPLLQQGTNNADTFNSDSNNNWFEGRGGNDIFNLGASNGGQDTLFYKLLNNADATGGNGTDVVNNFALGNTTSNLEADKIDLKELLINYNADADGAARFINGVATIDSGDTITQYLSVSSSGGNTTLFIDRDGSASAFSATALVTLNGTTVDLATLLANHQIIIG